MIMNPKFCIGKKYDKCDKKETFESMKKELDYIKEDINTIKQMQVSEEAKETVLKELQEQVDNVKERMHNLIDEL